MVSEVDNDEKEKLLAELVIANKELAFQNEEKGKRAAELVIANKELAFQGEEKDKRAAELITAKQYYKSLFENNNDAVYSFDLQGNFISCNAVLEEMFGYSKEELLNNGFHHLVEPVSLQKTQGYFMETIRTLSPQNYETTGIHRNGEIIELNVTNLPIIINKELITTA